MAVKKVCVSVYLEKENYEKFKKMIRLKEVSMSRYLSQLVTKIIDKEIKKGESKWALTLHRIMKPTTY